MLTRAAAATAVLLLFNGLEARADPWSDVVCDHASCDLGVGTGHHEGLDGVRPDSSHHPPGAGNENPFAGCRHVPVNATPPPGASQSGGWFMVLCSPDGKDPLSHGPVWIDDAEAVSVSPAELARVARERLQLPLPMIAVSPSGDQLVNLPTWLWLASGWASSSATAAVPGASVTATATATSVLWSMGDGSTVECSGPGTPYTFGTNPMTSSPDCGHVYRRSTANQPTQTFAVTVTVHWAVSWSGAGQSGTFDDMTTTSTVRLRVAEAQALNNGG